MWIKCSNFICITFASTAVRRSDFVFCISGVQTSPSYGSDVQTSSVSHLLASQIRRSDFVFCISGVQTSPSYGSDVYASSASHLLASQIRRSDFVFCISSVQTSPSYGSDVYTSSASHLLASQIRRFRLRLLHIRRSDFALIWIRCLHLICITFASIANQTFRLRLLHRRSDFAFIGSDVQTPSVSRLLASHFRRSDFVFYK